MSFVVLVLLQFQLMLRLRFRNLQEGATSSGFISKLVAKVDAWERSHVAATQDIRRRITLERVDDFLGSILCGLYFLFVCVYWTYFIAVSNNM